MTITGRIGNGNLAPPLFCLAAVAANQSVFRLGSLSLVVAAGLVLAILAIAAMAPDLTLTAPRREGLRWSNLAIGAIIVAPLVVTFTLGANRDFPFSGDHYFHVGQAYRIAFWWLSPPASAVVRVPTLDDVAALLRHPAAVSMSRAALAVLLTIVTCVVYRSQRLAALVVATLALLVWGLCEHTIFVRYPAGGYLLAMPFLGPAFLLHNVELAGRLANVLAPVLWLFVLRPWLVGRWPDLRILTFAVAIFWQQDVIYYVDSVYMEPWPLVLCLLAIELLIDRGAAGAPVACLLIGAAATVKEPVIFALPLMWLAGAPWRASWRERCRLTGCALAAGVPFVLYFVARGSVAADAVETSRGVALGLPQGMLSLLVHDYAQRLAASFTLLGGLLYLAALALLVVMTLRFTGRRTALVCMFVSGLSLVLLFVADRNSQGWLGYFRFQLPALPFLLAGLLALGYRERRVVVAAAAMASILLQASSAWVAIARAAGPVTAMNFIEHDDAAIFFPMKSLLAEARARGYLAAGTTVLAGTPDTSLRAIPGIPVAFGPPGAQACACSAEHPAAMPLYIRYANLSAPDASAGVSRLPSDRAPLWRAAAAARPACMAELRATCAHVLERVEGGETVAALGVSPVAGRGGSEIGR